jgi:septum formation protein
MQLVLVSASPRRKKILSDAGLSFYTETVEISEIVDENLNWQDAVSQIATDKLGAFLISDKPLKYIDYLAITADTMVLVDGQILGKPKSTDQAKEFLRLLSGRTHVVITAVSIYSSKLKSVDRFIEESKVIFYPLNSEQIDQYVATGRCMDKAGAYGLQDEDHNFVQKVEGSVNNVIGFPIETFLKYLEQRRLLDLFKI